MLVTAVGTDGNTLTWPPVATAFLPVPSELPVVGSKTIPACAGTMEPSVVVTLNGFVQGVAEEVPSAQMKLPRSPRRSPVRSAAVGTVVTTEAERRRRRP